MATPNPASLRCEKICGGRRRAGSVASGGSLDIDPAFKWLLANRSSQKFLPRPDFILDRFPDFVVMAKKDFG